MDADGSHPTADIHRLLMSTSDVVIASRYIGGSRVINVPLYRRAISILGNIYLHFRKPLNVRDRTNGFRAFNSQAMRILDGFESSEKGFSIQIEILDFLVMAGMKVHEIDTTFEYRSLGESKFDLKKVFEAFNKTRK